ncbi:barstar family protein [Streptomyces sp. NPDC048718]|uniref:barstar family protein n=1 Tax=Streptomyces sp. NPDC048718 TaxID=3365587 RepID=UPI003719FE15
MSSGEAREPHEAGEPREAPASHRPHEPGEHPAQEAGAPGDPGTAAHGLAALGRPVVLGLHGVADKAAFMDRCVAALRLPSWFGRNWDALADSLTDLPGRTVLVVTGWQEYAEARPAEWRTAQEVFAASVDERPGRLFVLLSLGDVPVLLGGSDEGNPSDLG